MWPFKKSEDREAQKKTLREDRIDRMNDAYDKGEQAGLAGAECWENPFLIDMFSEFLILQWHAGWCRGRQERAAKK